MVYLVLFPLALLFVFLGLYFRQRKSPNLTAARACGAIGALLAIGALISLLVQL